MFWVPKATVTGLVSAAVLTLGLGVGLTGNPVGPTAVADPPAKPTDLPKPKADPDARIQERRRELASFRDLLIAERERAMLQRHEAEQRLKKVEADVQIAEAQLAAAIKDLEALTPAGTSLVLRITADKNTPVMLSEVRKDGGSAWEVAFRPAKPDDLSGLRAYLTRAASDKSVAREVKFVGDKDTSHALVKNLVQVCADVGFTIALVELKPSAPGRGKPVDGPKPPAGIQATVPKGGTVTRGPGGTFITMPVGGVTRLTLSDGKFIGLVDFGNVPPRGRGDDAISLSMGWSDGAVAVSGVKPGEGPVIILQDDQGRKHTVRVAVTENGPG